MQVGAEVGWVAVTAVTSHCSGADLHHIRRTGLETFNAGVAPLGSHGMGDGLALVLQKQRQSVMKTRPNNSPSHSSPSHSLTRLSNKTMQRGKRNMQKRL